MKLFNFTKSLVFVVALTTIIGCQKETTLSETEVLDKELEALLLKNSNAYGKSFYLLPDEYDFTHIPQDPQNPLTTAKVDLGKFLFHETGISLNAKKAQGMRTYSCASCHHVDAGFQAGRMQGIGDGGLGFGTAGEGRVPNPLYSLDSLDVQPIRTPTALNGAYQTNMLWNGQFGATGVNEGTEYAWTTGTPKEKNHLGYQGLETQAIAGLGVHRLLIDTVFMNNCEFRSRFNLAFPSLPPNQRCTQITAGLAIAAYERTLLANKAPFQSWLRGATNAMSTEEKEGAILFFGKAECVKCHNGPALNSMKFYALGFNDLDGSGTYGTDPSKPENKGRGGFTGRAEDMYKFKVPQLYNLKTANFYGHGANFRSIYDIITYKNRGISQNGAVPTSQLASEFKPLGLTDNEVQKIASFISKSLYDPGLRRYVPYYVPSTFCFPNNDPQSKIDMNCH